MKKMFRAFFKDVMNYLFGFILPILSTFIFASFTHAFWPAYGFIATVIYFFTLLLVANIILWKRNI